VGYPVNRDRFGPKGENQWHANNSPDLLTTPLICNSHGILTPATFDEAMDLIIWIFKEQLNKEVPDSVGFYHSRQAFLEDYYTIAIITRAGIGTHNVDANTRLCTVTAEWSLIESFGSDGPPTSEVDIDEAELAVFWIKNSNETKTRRSLLPEASAPQVHVEINSQDANELTLDV
jgi:ferredoxin-nitrate reductase